jgi:hypothetical protein
VRDFGSNARLLLYSTPQAYCNTSRIRVKAINAAVDQKACPERSRMGTAKISRSEGRLFSRIQISFRIYLRRTDMGMARCRLGNLYPELLRRPRRRRMSKLMMVKIYFVSVILQ